MLLAARAAGAAPLSGEEKLAPFRKRSEQELSRLGDEELIAYVNAARDAGDEEAAIAALQIFAYGLEPIVRAFVVQRVGDLGPEVVDELVEQTLSDAIRAAESFEKRTAGQFRAWVRTIASRRIADDHRRHYVKDPAAGGDGAADEQERKEHRVREQALEWVDGDGEVHLHEIEAGDPADAIVDGLEFSRLANELNPQHRLVVVLDRFEDIPHREIAERVNRHFGLEDDDCMSESNVAKICSRFNAKLDGSGETDDDA